MESAVLQTNFSKCSVIIFNCSIVRMNSVFKAVFAVTVLKMKLQNPCALTSPSRRLRCSVAMSTFELFHFNVNICCFGALAKTEALFFVLEANCETFT